MTPLPESLLESVAAAAVREGLADAVFTRLSTPIGRLLVVQGREGVVRVGFEEEPEDRVLAEVAAGLGPRIVASDAELAATRDAIDAYFAGEGERLQLPVDFSLVRSPFRRAARAVGTACARNPIPIVVPCHRVLPGSGGVGNYGGGPERKRVLLTLEGAPWRA